MRVFTILNHGKEVCVLILFFRNITINVCCADYEKRENDCVGKLTRTDCICK